MADTDTVVLWVGLRSRVGESGNDGSVMRNDWSADEMDSRGRVSSGEAGLSEADLRTLLRMRIGEGLPAGVGLAAALSRIKHSDVRE